jgi:hypothetical protein
MPLGRTKVLTDRVEIVTIAGESRRRTLPDDADINPDPRDRHDRDDDVIVRIDDFLAARRDPVVHAMLDFADEYGKRLEAEDRNL